jgi:hypothetical protein
MRAVLWRTDGESGVDGECATFRDAALKEMGGYDQYGMSAPKCLLGADGQPLREQPRATGALERGCLRGFQRSPARRSTPALRSA